MFVDSSVWYAAADLDDQSHERAKELLTTDERLITSDHVLVESWFLCRGRLGNKAAEKLANVLIGGAAVVKFVHKVDVQVGMDIGRELDDQDFSLVDRTSLAIMRRLGIESVASFDNHFAVYRYGPGGKRAFKVLR